MLVLFFAFFGLAIGFVVELVVGLVIFAARRAGRLTGPTSSVPFVLAGTSFALAGLSGVAALLFRPHMAGTGTAPDAADFYFASALLCAGLFVALSFVQALIGGLLLLWARSREAAAA